MRMDVKEIKESKTRIERSIGNIDQLMRECVYEVANRVYAKAIDLTPVSQKNHTHMKDRWDIGSITKSGNAYEVEITNAAEYAYYVENGHRLVVKGVTVGWVDGQFMLRISEREVEKRLDRIVNQKLKKFYRGLL